MATNFGRGRPLRHHHQVHQLAILWRTVAAESASSNEAGANGTVEKSVTMYSAVSPDVLRARAMLDSWMSIPTILFALRSNARQCLRTAPYIKYGIALHAR